MPALCGGIMMNWMMDQLVDYRDLVSSMTLVQYSHLTVLCSPKVKLGQKKGRSLIEHGSEFKLEHNGT